MDERHAALVQPATPHKLVEVGLQYSKYICTVQEKHLPAASKFQLLVDLAPNTSLDEQWSHNTRQDLEVIAVLLCGCKASCAAIVVALL